MHDSLCKDSNVCKELRYFLLDQLIHLENTDDLSGKDFNSYLIFHNLAQICYPFRYCPGYIFRTSCLHSLYHTKHKPSCLEECGQAKKYIALSESAFFMLVFKEEESTSWKTNFC